jgi:hypothetical protein
MRNLIFSFLLLLYTSAIAQKETFDLATYTTPEGWNKNPTEHAVQFSKEDSKTNTYCIITLYKAMPGIGDSKKNFDAAWETLVKEAVTVTADPEMQPPATEDGWEVQSGYSTFESDGHKGIVLLVTSSGFKTMVNIVILTNTDAFEPGITGFLESISLKKPDTKTQMVTETNTNTNVKQQSAGSDGYTFQTTNFDDGWISVVKDDYVEVTKGSIKVLLFYRVTMTEQMRPPVINVKDYFWNKDIKPRYTVLSEEHRAQELMYSRTEYIEGDATDKQTNQNVYIAMNVYRDNGIASNIVVVATDKQTFLAAFPKPEDMEQMLYYNRFAVGAKDVIGNWSDFSSAHTQMYYVGTGGYAGMQGSSLSAQFFLKSNGSYSSKHSGISGVIGGSQQWFQEEYKGKYSVTNWDITMTNRFKGESDAFHCWFEVIPGGRILHLQDKTASGIQYHLFKEK